LKSPITIGLLLSGFAVIIGVHLLFSRVESNRTKAIATVIGTLLRDESSVSNSYLLAKSIEDMHVLGIVNCARLSRFGDHSNPAFYDSTYKRDCDLDQLQSIKMTGIDGNIWQFDLVPSMDFSFSILKWITTLSTLTLILVTYLILTHLLRTERKRRESSEQRQSFLEDLTKQVGHDVASPLTALKLITAKTDLDSGTKAFLMEIANRTEGIFAKLKRSDATPEKICLKNEITKVIREKQVSTVDFPETTVDVGEHSLHSVRAEFDRVLSNLLDNACDAGAQKIEIRAIRNEKSLIVSIGDDGKEFPDTVRQRLGLRGNTLGKANGSGLGLYHAYQFMSNIGGRLTLGNSTLDKVTLVFPI